MSPAQKINVVDTLKSFPAMSGAAVKLLELLDDQETDTTEIENILRRDPNLTVNILKLTNSAYFGLTRKVGSVRQAVVLLGWKKLMQLVMISCMQAMMEKEIPGYDLPAGELWHHSIAVSVAAEGIMRELDFPSTEEVFTAALLHDIGKQAMGTFVQEELGEIEKVTEEGESFVVAERMVLGIDHAEIGAQILNKWSFPPELVKAVRWHHEPDACEEENPIADIVHVANVLCLMIGIGVGREGLRYEPSPSATKRLGLKTVHLEGVASQVGQWVSDLNIVRN
jgi:putative nucleotidyltransferase with HDIG domain